MSHWKYQVYTKSQEASGAAALAQALVEGGLMAIEVGAGDIKWSLLWSFQAAIDALWPHTWIRKRLKYIYLTSCFFLDLTCLPIPLYNIDICVIHIFMHACMHAYIHTYKHACIHTYIQTYIHTVQTDRHTYIYTDTQTYNHTDRHPYRHTYIQTDR